MADFVFFSVYVVATSFINTVLYSRFFNSKRYTLFVLSIVLIIVGILFLEELVLEPIFYPDTRGQHFYGFFRTFFEISPFIIIPVWFYLMIEIIKKQKKMEELEKNIYQSELQILIDQINPHFLFNNLNNIYSHAVEQSDKTPELIIQLSSLLRYILYDCKSELVPINKEIEHIESYIGLYQLQIEGRGQINFRSNIKPEQSSLLIAPLILNVFIENAFKHSLGLSKDINIDIEVRISSNKYLVFKCSNTYEIKNNSDELGHGIGLNNVISRLKLLYPDSFKLDLNQDKYTYQVELSLDLDGVKMSHS